MVTIVASCIARGWLAAAATWSANDVGAGVAATAPCGMAGDLAIKIGAPKEARRELAELNRQKPDPQAQALQMQMLENAGEKAEWIRDREEPCCTIRSMTSVVTMTAGWAIFIWSRATVACQRAV